jgi:hypothetical protein
MNRSNVLFLSGMIAIMSFSVPDLTSQVIELNGFAGYQLHGTARLYEGDFEIEDAMNYGGRIAVGLSHTMFVELSYMRSDTEGRYYSYYDEPSEVVPFSSNYIHIAGLQEAEFGIAAPFLTVGMGMVIWDPKTSALSSKAQFSLTVGGGIKIWLTDFLGIRLQGSMMMPMVVNGVGFGCGVGTSGSSCGSSVYTRITPFQGEFSGGLIFCITPD